MAGAAVNALRHVTVTGKSRDWVCGQADALLRKCGWRGSLKCRLTRAAEAGPTLSGPPHPAIDRVVVLDIGGRGSTMTDGLAMRQLAMVPDWRCDEVYPVLRHLRKPRVPSHWLSNFLVDCQVPYGTCLHPRHWATSSNNGESSGYDQGG